MKDKGNRGIALVLTIIICITSISFTPANQVSAASKYITVTDFAKALAAEIGLSPISGEHSSGYVNALLDKGIIEEGDFSSYSGYLSRTDLAVLINRTDEYLYGDTLDPKLVQIGLEKRISDIKKIKASKRTDVVKCYLKGMIKGYSNGTYSDSREYRGSRKITKSSALSCIKMLKNKSLRARISPDGQLIRTTNLPKYAKKYPYILASYPNSYYDWQFHYEGMTRTRYNPDTGKEEVIPFVYLEEYASPADVDKTTEIDNFAEVKNEKSDLWVEKVKTHMNSIFNVDYRTIDEDWINTVLSVDYTYGYRGMEDQTKSRLEKYAQKVKDNKTIIESSKIAVDGSSLYFFDGDYFLRVYVKYRIVSSETTYTPREGYETNNLFYTNYPVSFISFDIGEWKECCFDVALTSYTHENIYGIYHAIIFEQHYTDCKIK